MQLEEDKRFKQINRISERTTIFREMVPNWNWYYDRKLNPLNSSWMYGQIIITNNNYEINAMYLFCTMERMWRIINTTLLNSSFDMNSSNTNEIYFFRENIYPHWTQAKKKTYSGSIHEIVIRFKKDGQKSEFGSLSREATMIFIIAIIGETFISKFYTGDIIGIRIRPSKFGGTTRIWTQNSDSVPSIKAEVNKILINFKLGYELVINTY